MYCYFGRSQALEDIISLGIRRVLTSGGCPSAEQVRSSSPAGFLGVLAPHTSNFDWQQPASYAAALLCLMRTDS